MSFNYLILKRMEKNQILTIVSVGSAVVTITSIAGALLLHRLGKALNSALDDLNNISKEF